MAEYALTFTGGEVRDEQSFFSGLTATEFSLAGEVTAFVEVIGAEVAEADGGIALAERDEDVATDALALVVAAGRVTASVLGLGNLTTPGTIRSAGLESATNGAIAGAASGVGWVFPPSSAVGEGLIVISWVLLVLDAIDVG